MGRFIYTKKAPTNPGWYWVLTPVGSLPPMEEVIKYRRNGVSGELFYMKHGRIKRLKDQLEKYPDTMFAGPIYRPIRKG